MDGGKCMLKKLYICYCGMGSVEFDFLAGNNGELEYSFGRVLDGCDKFCKLPCDFQ